MVTIPELVGKKTKKKTTAGRDVYKTLRRIGPVPKGSSVSELGVSIPLNKKKTRWLNAPSIYHGVRYTDDEILRFYKQGQLKPSEVEIIEGSVEDAVRASQKRSSKLLKRAEGGPPKPGKVKEPTGLPKILKGMSKVGRHPLLAVLQYLLSASPAGSPPGVEEQELEHRRMVEKAHKWIEKLRKQKEEGLISSPTEIDAYHGTTEDFDIFKYLPGSGGDLGFHFGTPEQAEDRLRERTQYSTPEQKAQGKIFASKLSLGKILETSDMPSFEEWSYPGSVAKLLLGTKWGKTRQKELNSILSGAKALSQKIDDTFEAEDESLLALDFWERLRETDMKGRMDLLSKVRDLLKADGYDGIKYVNKYEDPKSRSYSYIVFDPENISINKKDSPKSLKSKGGSVMMRNPYGYSPKAI